MENRSRTGLLEQKEHAEFESILSDLRLFTVSHAGLECSSIAHISMNFQDLLIKMSDLIGDIEKLSKLENEGFGVYCQLWDARMIT